MAAHMVVSLPLSLPLSWVLSLPLRLPLPFCVRLSFCCHCDLSLPLSLSGRASLGEQWRGARGNNHSAQEGARAQHEDALVEGAEARKATSVQENAGGRRPASGRGWGRRGGGKNNGGAAPAAGQGESYTGEPMIWAGGNICLRIFAGETTFWQGGAICIGKQ